MPGISKNLLIAVASENQSYMNMVLNHNVDINHSSKSRNHVHYETKSSHFATKHFQKSRKYAIMFSSVHLKQSVTKYGSGCTPPQKGKLAVVRATTVNSYICYSLIWAWTTDRLYISISGPLIYILIRIKPSTQNDWYLIAQSQTEMDPIYMWSSSVICLLSQTSKQVSMAAHCDVQAAKDTASIVSSKWQRDGPREI